MNTPAAEFDCVECGRHIIVVAGPVTQFRLCATCIMLPGWVDDDELCAMLDPDCPRGGWGCSRANSPEKAASKL